MYIRQVLKADIYLKLRGFVTLDRILGSGNKGNNCLT